MDARRALPFLLLVICTINAASSIHNGRGRPNNVRRVRRINEYLVPPPPPPPPSRFHPHPDRVPRLVNSQPADEPGYIARLMNWINPLNYFMSQSPSPPSLPPQPEISYPPKFIHAVPPASYNGPAPVDYEIPPPASNDHSDYPALPIKTKNCNPCNKVPWMPIQQESTYSGDASYASSPSLESQSGGYVSRNPEAPHDAYYAASHEIKAPDFSYVPPLPGGLDSSFVGPLPNPQLYPGVMPPIFKATDFNPPRVTPDENSGHIGATSSVPGNGAPTGNDQSVHLDSPNYLLAGGDAIQESQFFTNTGIVNSQSSGFSNNGGHYDVTRSSGSPGNFLDNTSQSNQNIPSYGISDFDQVPNSNQHGYNDLTSSANVVKGSHVPAYTPDESFEKIADSVSVVESPLLDFTHKNESRTHLSSIPPTSNAFADFEIAESVGTTVAFDDEIFQTQSTEYSTDSFLSEGYEYVINDDTTLAKELKINDSATQDAESLHASRKQNTKVHSIWSHRFLSPTNRLKDTFKKILSDDDIMTKIQIDNSNVNTDVTSGQQNRKRNKQVQVIIPYTSQHTPLSFQPSHEKNVSDTGESNPDSYIGEESRNRLKIVKPPNSPVFQPAPTTLSIFEATTRNPVDTKANNSIDVHKLQKNIDNWTIEKFLKTTTPSTVTTISRSSPYLAPSKTIPKAYFTTTEPVNRITDSYNDNVKTFTLTGFSSNDHKPLTNHRMEGSRIQVKTSTESLINAPITSEQDTWRRFPMGISSVNKERVYIVTPQPQTTPRSNLENRKQKAFNEAESNTEESKITSQTDAKETRKSDTFESIEKAYQVLPQAVNNLAVASTGPESVSLWGIMEHEDFASLAGSEYDSNDTEPPVYSRLSKESRARR